MSVRAGVVGFNLSPVLKLCLFDGPSEGIAGFVINSVRILPVIHGFWLGYVRTVTEVVYSTVPLDESQNVFQSVLAKQSYLPNGGRVSALYASLCVE